MSKDQNHLMAFAYELRKQDVDNLYSYEFLNGQVKPAVLVDIIMSNSWNEIKSKMKVDHTFYMSVGRGFFLTHSNNDKRPQINDIQSLPDGWKNLVQFELSQGRGLKILTSENNCLSLKTDEVLPG